MNEYFAAIFKVHVKKLVGVASLNDIMHFVYKRFVYPQL